MDSWIQRMCTFTLYTIALLSTPLLIGGNSLVSEISPIQVQMTDLGYQKERIQPNPEKLGESLPVTMKKKFKNNGESSRQGGAITLDPVSIISLLALGAFLINNILQLLRSNQILGNSGRSLDMVNLNLPLDLSDMADKLETSRLMEAMNGRVSFTKFFENVGHLYYLTPKKRAMCMRKVICGFINSQQSRGTAEGSFKIKAFDFMLSTIIKLVAPEISRNSTRVCQKFNNSCGDTMLHDAKMWTENKMYSFVTHYAIQKLLSG